MTINIFINEEFSAMAEHEKKPEKPSKWGFKMPDLSGAMKGVSDAAKAAGEKAKAAGAKAGEMAKDAGHKAGEMAKDAGHKAQDAAKQAQDKLKKDKPAETAPPEKKEDNKPPSP